MGLLSTSGSRTSETEQNFLTTFFHAFLEKCQHFPKKCHLSPKISDDLFFLVIDLFHVLICYFSVRGAKSVADIDTGGQNPYISTNSQCYHYSFCPRGGENSVANFDGGHGRICPPRICHCG